MMSKMIPAKDLPCYQCICFPMCKLKFMRDVLECPYVNKYLNSQNTTAKYNRLVKYLHKGI
jgi:hypothetical protein